VTYRAGDIVLPRQATWRPTQASSIFLEESYQQKGNVKTFAGEIPYLGIVQLNECREGPKLNASMNESKESTTEPAASPARSN